MKETTLNFLNSACSNMYSCGVLAIAYRKPLEDRLLRRSPRNNDSRNCDSYGALRYRNHYFPKITDLVGFVSAVQRIKMLPNANCLCATLR